MKKITLLWSENDPREGFGDDRFIDDLNLGALFNLNPTPGGPDKKTLLSKYVTKDPATIARRCEIFQKLLSASQDFVEKLTASTALLRDLSSLSSRRGDVETDAETALYSVKEIEVFLSCIESFHNTLQIAPDCAAFNELRAEIDEEFSSEDYAVLKSEEQKQKQKIELVKSVTIAVNLDAQLRPIEAGVVSIEDHAFKSESIVDRLLRRGGTAESGTSVTPLLPASKGSSAAERAALKDAILAILNRFFHSTIKSWSPQIHRFVLSRAQTLCAVLPELEFILICSSVLRSLREKGFPLCVPVFSSEDHVRSLYNPRMALSGSRMVKNDLDFDSSGRIYILTGPNRGGKSVYLESVGVFYSMLHLGLLLPAEQAEVSPVGEIITHFNKELPTEYGESRFGEECKTIAALSREMAPDTLFLFDEALSGTSGEEARYIAEEILRAYSEIGLRGIFSTHLHELCPEIPSINEGNPRSKLDHLSMAIDPVSHERLFSAVRGAGSGKSYAMDIARKYGLTKDSILSNRLQ